MRKAYKLPGAIRLVLVASLSLGLVACGSSGGKAITPLNVTSTTSNATIATTTDLTTTTLLTSDAAAISALQNEVNVFFQAASANPVDPANPSLATVETGEALSYARTQLTGLSLKHEHNTGNFVLTDASVTQRNTSGLPSGDVEAVVVSACATDSIGVAADATGSVVVPATNSRDPIKDRLDLINGRWMVSETSTPSGTC